MTNSTQTRVIKTLLIANRGEIACRIIRTARRLGIRTVAVYSDADAGAAHVAAADLAVRLGPAPARESYLKADLLLEVAKATGADAVHPGYGFLSENAGFAEACAASGVIFIGPPPSAIAAMGSKSAAKALMEKAGVPLVPGYHGDRQEADFLAGEAARIGFPLLIKASAGGGGKGMKIVRDAGEFDSQLASAKREALASFGDDHVLIERYLTKPRHIEVQVFFDTQGNGVYLYERDCSIQRRHQKVVEEAPAPGISAERRAAMGKAAVEAARAVGYVGAGTVEFIAEGEDFFFMEMNTRLQVEHPVTEAITQQDLVEWQIRVAEGHPLPLTQETIPLVGHAVEVRLYAEDPLKEFLPQVGRLSNVCFGSGEGVRVDTGVRSGDSISIYYDPMIAKVIAYGPDRGTATQRLIAALNDSVLTGVTTNRAFLTRILAHPAFAAADLDTGFIERYRDVLLPAPVPASDDVLGLATLAAMLRSSGAATAAQQSTNDPFSPWALTTGWRLNRDAWNDISLQEGEQSQTVRAHYRGEGFEIDLPSGPVPARGTLTLLAEGGARLTATLGDRSLSALVFDAPEGLWLHVEGTTYRFTLIDPRRAADTGPAQGGRLRAPMPGKIIAISVAVGDMVEAGAVLMLVEAMKMEHAIRAPKAGKITAIAFAVGDLVDDGVDLLTLEAEEVPA